MKSKLIVTLFAGLFYSPTYQHICFFFTMSHFHYNITEMMSISKIIDHFVSSINLLITTKTKQKTKQNKKQMVVWRVEVIKFDLLKSLLTNPKTIQNVQVLKFHIWIY